MEGSYSSRRSWLLSLPEASSIVVSAETLRATSLRGTIISSKHELFRSGSHLIGFGLLRDDLILDLVVGSLRNNLSCEPDQSSRGRGDRR